MGGLLSDSDIRLLTFVLAPNSVISLGDTGFELRVDGGAFDPNTSFNINVSTLITVDSVTRQGGSVPEPAVFALLGIGLLAMVVVRRNNKRSH